jgi:signal transduction histidine kinase/CheY-like chemotaxis protein
MATRIALVLIVSTAIGYYHLRTGLTSETLDQLSRYVVTRGQREQAIFSLAEDNVAVLQRDYVARLRASAGLDPKEEFDRYVTKGEDGVYRNAKGPVPFDNKREIGAFIGRNVTVDAATRRRVIAARDILASYGPAWNNRFQDTYVDLAENIVVIHWPGVDWAQSAPADLDIAKEEYIWAADFEHNPGRRTVWTGPYFDLGSKTWMISCVAPVDLDGEYLGVVGHDIVLNELVDRTINDRIEGTYNILFRGDGRLIAHPGRMDEIVKKQGVLNIAEAEDESLRRIYDLTRQKAPGESIADNSEAGEYLAVARIEGPDYYLVTVFPKALITRRALEMARIFLLLGLGALLVEIIIMYFVLRRQVKAPLSALVAATDRVRGGDLNIALDDRRDDELGALSASFNAMTREVRVRETGLRTAKEEATRLSKSLARSNEELAGSLARSEETSRLKGEFLANISHELRSPLNAIVNIPDGLLEDFEGREVVHCKACKSDFEREPGEAFDPEAPCPECGASGSSASHGLRTMFTYRGDADETAGHLRSLARSGAHLLRLINDVLDFSKLEAGKMTADLEDVSAAELLADALANAKPLADKSGITLALAEVPASLRLRADPTKCAQILLNLIVNAIKFSEPGGAVELFASGDGPDCVFSVRDHGIGIAPEHQSLIFESFRQVDGSHTRKYGGTGLGLAITQKLVRLHGGRIWVESELNKGSTFYVRLPIAGPAPSIDADEAAPRAPAAAPKAGEKAVILVVDDEPVAIETIRLSLRDEPYHIVGLTDPRRVDEFIEKYSPDLVILDIMMPRASGATILRELRAKRAERSLPVVVCSAYPTNEAIAAAFGAAWLAKPWQGADLLRSIELALKRGERGERAEGAGAVGRREA